MQDVGDVVDEKWKYTFWCVIERYLSCFYACRNSRFILGLIKVIVHVSFCYYEFPQADFMSYLVSQDLIVVVQDAIFFCSVRGTT